MERFLDWWKREDRYITMVKAVLMAALPFLCCAVSCAVQGKTIGQVYLPNSEWNDELFYFKQVEGIVRFGYPQGYFGFNESHALRLSFAAWSPVLLFPWILWGLVFGWNLMSPIYCNLFLMTLCCFLFVWLVRPSWRQTGVLALLFCLYTPFVRYILSGMPEIICFTMVILFYGLALNYLRCEKKWKLVLLIVMSAVMTLMRPYMLLFLLLPLFFWIRKSGWKGALGSVLVLGTALGAYACIKHYLGAEYFAPLFFTDWVTAYFEQGLLGGLRYSVTRLHYMGRSFLQYTLEGFRSGMAAGAFFGGYLAVMAVLFFQSVRDFLKWRRRKKNGLSEKPDCDGGLAGRLIIEAHLACSYAAMLFALLMMYKLTEGSKHLLTFMAVGLFLVAMMETRFYRKAVFVGAVFAYLFSYKAVAPYDYQVPFVTEERRAQVEEWSGAFHDRLQLLRKRAPDFENDVIWVVQDETADGIEYIVWQPMYGLPEGFGISCCMPEYVIQNLDGLQSRYMLTASGGKIDEMCQSHGGFEELYRSGPLVLYRCGESR